jgi:SAM-dependent methyltransferase
MKTDRDAFGKHLLVQYSAILKGEEVFPEIVERDDNYIDYGSLSRMYFSEYGEWAETEQNIIDRAEGKILDIGCGAGRHSLYLQKKGFEVTGIDNSPGAIEVCKARGLQKSLVRSIDEIDKFEPNSFDTILMLGNNFGLVGDAEKAKSIFQNFDRITKPGAKIIAQTLDPYKTDDKTHLRYQKRNRKLGRMSGQIRLRIRYGVFAGEWFDYLFVSPEEMEKILKETNWQIGELINGEEANYFAILEKRM